MTNEQTILVAGATGSIGGGAAIALAKRGASVVLLGRKLETLEARRILSVQLYLKRRSIIRMRTLPRW
jgi:NADP-dependent 3-hydroxy acid dehydrogenase YdfG